LALKIVWHFNFNFVSIKNKVAKVDSPFEFGEKTEIYPACLSMEYIEKFPGEMIVGKKTFENEIHLI
jgi:hypothetical protein